MRERPFELSDSRVHVANVGMRWPKELDRNVALAEAFTPPFDVALLPCRTAGIYQVEDLEADVDNERSPPPRLPGRLAMA